MHNAWKESESSCTRNRLAGWNSGYCNRIGYTKSPEEYVRENKKFVTVKDGKDQISVLIHLVDEGYQFLFDKCGIVHPVPSLKSGSYLLSRAAFATYFFYSVAKAAAHF